MPQSSPYNAQLAALRDLLKSPRRLALVTHFNPDGDAVGSTLGLAHVLKAEGHAVQVVHPNPAPRNLHWMPGHAAIINHVADPKACQEALAAADLVFCLDFNRQDRVEGLETALRAASLKVLIDHHRDPEDFARVAFTDVDASSTCQLVHELIQGMGWARHIDAACATCLFAGIMTDSGSFRFPTTGPRTFRAAADLVERGARPEDIHQANLDDNTVERLRLNGYALSEKLELLPGGEAVLITLSQAEHDRFRYVPGDTEGLVNQGLSIRGVRLSAFLAERNGLVKISMRSKGALPVNEFLAGHFQGGGHANAAGGRSGLPLAEATEQFKLLLAPFLAKHPA